jgi:hypothetical protein
MEVRGPGQIRGFSVTADIGTLHAWLDPASGNESVTLGEVLSLSLAIQVHR